MQNQLNIWNMTKNEILQIAAKYRKMSDQELKYGADKCALFDRIADQLEDDVDMYVDDDLFQSEREIIEDILELFDDDDSFLDDEEESENDEYLIVLNEVAKSALHAIGIDDTDSRIINLMGTILIGISSGDNDNIIAGKAFAELMLTGFALDIESIKEMCKNTREKCQKHLLGLQIAIDTIQDYHCNAEIALMQVANIL